MHELIKQIRIAYVVAGAIGFFVAIFALAAGPRSHPVTYIAIYTGVFLAIVGSLVYVLYFWRKPKEKHLPNLSKRESRIIAAYRRGDKTSAIKAIVEDEE